MKQLLTLVLALSALTIKAQTRTVENPRLHFKKQEIAIFSDSALQHRKVVSTDFLKFKLLAWKNGSWKAYKIGLSSQPVETVYIKDNEFIKTPEYREVLESYDATYKQKHTAYHSHLVKHFGKKIGDGIYYAVPVIGMNYEQFYMCRDKPDKTNIIESKGGRSEQLVYRFASAGAKYYYFTNGKLTAIQD